MRGCARALLKEISFATVPGSDARSRRSRRRPTRAAAAPEVESTDRRRRRAEPAGADGQSSTTDDRRSAAAAAAAGATARRARPPAAARRPPPAEAATTAAEPKAETRKPPSASSARHARPAGARRRKRAPLPKAKRELLVSVDAGEKRVAVLEDDLVAEVYLERPEHRSIAGNVYLGIVDNVLPGMEAAFVEIGLEKNGFLYVDEIVGPELEGRKGARKIQDLIQRGQTILVQAVKDPMKTKGARLTTEISLPGRFVVFVPHGDGLGVSRRLEDDERNRLKAILKEHRAEEGRRDRPHRRRGRVGRGHRARPRLPAAALEVDRGEGEGRRRRRRSSTRRPSCRCASRATSSPATSSGCSSTTTARTSASSAT